MADDFGYSGTYPFETVPGLLSPEMNNNLRTRTMLGASGGLLSAAGWSKTPVNIWEALGRGIQGGLGEYSGGMNDAMRQQLVREQIMKLMQENKLNEQWQHLFAPAVPGGTAAPSGPPGGEAAPMSTGPQAPPGLISPPQFSSLPGGQGGPISVPPQASPMTVRQTRATGDIRDVIDELPPATRALVGMQGRAKGMETVAQYIGAKDKPSDTMVHFRNPENDQVISFRANDPRVDSAINNGWQAVTTPSSNANDRQPKSYLLPNNKNVLSNDGKTYEGEDGRRYKLPTNAVPLGAETAYDTVQQARSQANAAAENGKLPPEQPRVSLEDVAKAATGPYNAWQAGVNATAGGLGFDKLLGQDGVFRDTEANRNYLRLVQQTGKGALINNPRFPVKEQETVDNLFPNPDKWVTNPRTEADKVPLLRDRLNMQLRINNEELQRPGIDRQRRDKLESNNIETKRTIELLGPGSSDANATLRGNEEPAKPAPIDVTKRPIWQQMKAGDIGISKGRRYLKNEDGSAKDLGPAR